MTRALPVALLCSCAAARTPPAEPAQPVTPEPAAGVAARLPEDPIEAARRLRELATDDPDALAAYVDQSFVARVPSSGTLAGTLGPAPEGCDVRLSLEDGYGAIAIPPPMTDDSEEEAAEIEASIATLSAGVEVHGTCTMEITELDEGDEGEPVESTYQQEVAVFAVALGRGDAGWRVLGWRHFYSETGHNR